jgi:hypothetical protein
MAEIGFDGSGVLATIGELIAGAVAQHVATAPTEGLVISAQEPSHPSGPGLLERVVLKLMPGRAGELPAMIVCRHRVGKVRAIRLNKQTQFLRFMNPSKKATSCL